jgi:hypothetical protein
MEGVCVKYIIVEIRWINVEVMRGIVQGHAVEYKLTSIFTVKEGRF